MEDLREKTHTQHFELYRQKRLQEMGFSDMSADNRPVRSVRLSSYNSFIFFTSITFELTLSNTLCMHISISSNSDCCFVLISTNTVLVIFVLS